ncbi:MAG: 30S ribosome-binding factor RbfA [Syntrophales bacterium]|nr:30S ribosome-binding factor RbfA [Syntrophales bacterium]
MATIKRSIRVAEQIMVEMADIMRKEMGDPRMAMVTLTGVKVSDDLRHAKVFFVEMGQETCREETKMALEHASGFFRRELGRRLCIRYVPELTFIADTSFAYGTRIENLLREIHEKEESGK